jgi:hypothetical protein
VDGLVFLNGAALDIETNNSFAPSLGTTYRILAFTPGDLSGSFDFTSPAFDGATEMFAIDYDNADGYVALTVVPSSGPPPPAPVPEPAALTLTGVGLIALAIWGRKVCQTSITLRT